MDKKKAKKESVYFACNFDKPLHTALSKISKKESRSLTGQVVYVLNRFIENPELFDLLVSLKDTPKEILVKLLNQENQIIRTRGIPKDRQESTNE